MSFNKIENSFRISDLSDPSIKTGTFTIGITLVDEREAYSEYNITLSVHEAQEITFDYANAPTNTTNETEEDTV